MRRQLRAALVAGVALTGLTGCGGGSSTSAPAAPPADTGLPRRPAVLRIDDIDPCVLLTSAQQAAMRVEGAHRNDFKPGDSLRGASCIWSHDEPKPRYGYSASLLMNRGAEFALGAEPLRMVGGYAATTTTTPVHDQRYDCLMLVDVAPGQSLLSEYLNTTSDIPGMTHVRACDKAQAAAELMLANLRAAQSPGVR